MHARRNGSLLALAMLATISTMPAELAAQDLEGCPLDHVGCHTEDVDFLHRDALFDGVMLDSGWQPAGAPVQVRFALFLGGETEVAMGGRSITSWPNALDVAVPGRVGTGRLRVDYGIEIIARIRIDVEVAGIRYDWEGDIPFPGGIPRDLRVAGEVEFDPFLLPPSTPRPVTVYDDTDRVTVLNVDLTDAIIPIPGIGGGFLVDAVGSLEGSYRTDRIEITDAIADIVEENASVLVRPAPGEPELGAAKDLFILPHGTVGYDGVITLYPTLYIEIAGRRFDLVLADVPVPVVDLESPTEFNTAEVHVPLPDVRVAPRTLGFEAPVGGVAEALLTITNEGEATLVFTPGMPSGPFEVDTEARTLLPSASVRVPVRFLPTEAGSHTGVLLLATTDPDEPLVTVQLQGNASGMASSDADVGPLDGGVGTAPIDGGCGCRAAGGEAPMGAPLALLAIAALASRATRRRAR